MRILLDRDYLGFVLFEPIPPVNDHHAIHLHPTVGRSAIHVVHFPTCSIIESDLATAIFDSDNFASLYQRLLLLMDCDIKTGPLSRRRVRRTFILQETISLSSRIERTIIGAN